MASGLIIAGGLAVGASALTYSYLEKPPESDDYVYVLETEQIINRIQGRATIPEDFGVRLHKYEDLIKNKSILNLRRQHTNRKKYSTLLAMGAVISMFPVGIGIIGLLPRRTYSKNQLLGEIEALDSIENFL